MSKIVWNTQVNAPCIGEIISLADTRKSKLIQTDWDYPGVASNFGWKISEVSDDKFPLSQSCHHQGTDGTVTCPVCKIPATKFIESAADFLRDNDGAETEDPGYFDGE